MVNLMSNFDQLLTATIEHFQEEKARGVRFIEVGSDTLGQLKSGPKRSETSPNSTVKAVDNFRPATLIRPLVSTESELKNPVATPEVGPIESPKPVISREAKEAGLQELRERAGVCQKCPNLAASRKNVVFGVGDTDAALMFVGEAPGAEEDVKGEPFVGPAGQLLTRIIQTMGLSREKVYIANVLKCRPETPGQSFGNRKPTPEEMSTCLPYLQAQIDLIQPKIIVALGGTAIEGLFGKTLGVTRLRGKWQRFRGTPVMPTFHPSYLLHKEALGEKRKVWEDMLQVMEGLGLEVTEKHRGYFLKG